ncbi:hypothetical protein Lser_V15G03014 [Lactuca serriola]
MSQVTIGGFLGKRPRSNHNESGEGSSQTPFTNQSIPSVSNAIPQTPCSNESNETIDLKDLPKDPADRPKITSYKSNVRDDVRRAYLLQGPCQIMSHKFPKKKIGDRLRSFVPSWFEDFDCLAFRGHDESVNSENRGLYIEVLKAMRETSEDIFNNTLENAPKNNQLIFPNIQKELVQCFSQEVHWSIRQEISLGFVTERFIGLVHVKDTSSLTLKNVINEVLTSNKLSFSQIRGQGYDVASTMRGEFNGLKDLILQENDTAFYVHCFAHQLRLVVVAVAKKRDGVSDFLSKFCWWLMLFVPHVKENTYYENKQEKGCKKDYVVVNLKWGKVLDFVKEKGGSLANRQQASRILSYFKSYEFVFYLYKMYEILRLTGTLSKQLQRKDLDILEVASMVRGTMEGLKVLRNTGFASILPKVEIFNTVVDMQLLEYQDQFSETTTQLLEYMGALSPCDSFAQFDKSKLLKLGELYKYDFDDLDMIDLEVQLDIFYHYCIKDERFTTLKGISDLSRLMVSTGKHQSYPLVYKLLKLTLILPIAIASVERCFSKLKLLKTN